MGRFFFAGTHSIQCVLIFLMLNWSQWLSIAISYLNIESSFRFLPRGYKLLNFESHQSHPIIFLLGIIAALLKSDLEIPPSSSKFISLYLLFAIGFKGGQELSHSAWNNEILLSIIFGLLIASLIPLYCFWILKCPELKMVLISRII